MSETPYTVHDTPGIVERVESDLATAQDAIREADPHLRSLVLTGGFARGEGTVLDGEPQNDYDFVAIRGLGRARRGYDVVASDLEDALGLHIDLAPVPAWRLRWVRSSIFWYETALRGRVLWGENMLDRIPVRDANDLARDEALRLLVNRAAGLLLVTRTNDAHAHRIQAAKAILAALDAHLFARNAFPPSQRERWHRFQYLRGLRSAPDALEAIEPHVAWAYRFKVDPGNARHPDPGAIWAIAARALLDAVPTALEHAGHASLEDYAASDGLLDHAYYALNAGSIPEAHRLAGNPTGTVRAATLRMLAARLEGNPLSEAARESLASVASVDGQPLDLLEALREVTLQ